MALSFIYWFIWAAALVYALVQNGLGNIRPLITPLAFFVLTGLLGYQVFGHLVK